MIADCGLRIADLPKGNRRLEFALRVLQSRKTSSPKFRNRQSAIASPVVFLVHYAWPGCTTHRTEAAFHDHVAHPARWRWPGVGAGALLDAAQSRQSG